MNVRAIKNSRFGRFVTRVLGEETGAVAMEYVILAVLIAVAAFCIFAFLRVSRSM